MIDRSSPCHLVSRLQQLLRLPTLPKKCFFSRVWHLKVSGSPKIFFSPRHGPVLSVLGVRVCVHTRGFPVFCAPHSVFCPSPHPPLLSLVRCSSHGSGAGHVSATVAFAVRLTGAAVKQTASECTATGAHRPLLSSRPLERESGVSSRCFRVH